MPRPSRLWPSVLVGALFMPVTVLGASALVQLLGSDGGGDEELSPGHFRALMWSAAACDVVVIVLLMALSRENLRERFRVGDWSLSMKWVPLMAIGTWIAAFVGVTTSLLLFGSTGEWAQQRQSLLVSGGGPSTLELLVLVALLPPLVEELVFRGYVQGRLLRRLPVPVAVGLASVLFASAHGELEYAVQVFPMGVWFGTVAVLARSIWPSVALHALQNGVAVIAMLLAAEASGAVVEQAASEEPLELGVRVVMFLVLGVPAALILWLLGRFLARRVEREPVVPIGPPVRPI